MFHLLSFPRKACDNPSPSRSWCWLNNHCFVFCKAHVSLTSSSVFMECQSPHQWGHTHLDAARHLGDDFHDHFQCSWRRRDPKPNLYCQVLAWQATSQHSKTEREGLEYKIIWHVAILSYTEVCYFLNIFAWASNVPSSPGSLMYQFRGSLPVAIPVSFLVLAIVLAAVFGVVQYRKR